MPIMERNANAEIAILRSSLIEKLDKLSSEILECSYKQGGFKNKTREIKYVVSTILSTGIHNQFYSSRKYNQL